MLIVTAVDREAEAIGAIDGALVVAGGIGRTNAAVTTTQAILDHGPFSAVISMGVAGSLPDRSGNAAAAIGDIAAASTCVYAEEGLITPEGFRDMTGLGFALGDFAGNAVPVDEALLRGMRSALERSLSAESAHVGPIATVATCSGTDEAAREIANRTGAIAEAMEGAAVVHAARRFNLPGGELRVISNTTGDRDAQVWDLAGALSTLGGAAHAVVRSILAGAGGV